MVTVVQRLACLAVNQKIVGSNPTSHPNVSFFHMVTVVQRLAHLVVAQETMGSNPISHPTKKRLLNGVVLIHKKPRGKIG